MIAVFFQNSFVKFPADALQIHSYMIYYISLNRMGH